VFLVEVDLVFMYVIEIEVEKNSLMCLVKNTFEIEVIK
jgi:hypothetical protein